jgi:hypothetical protein
MELRRFSLSASLIIIILFTNWLNGVVQIICLKYLLEWEHLLLSGRFGYIEITSYSLIKIVLPCR